MSLFILVKYLHVVLAIIAVGFNASYAIWLARAAKEPAHLSFALRGIKVLDDRFANPAYVLLLITGLTMVVVGNLPLTTLWIGAALVLWFIAVIIGIALYSPTLRLQIATLEKEGAESADYQRVARRGTILGIVLAVIVLVIVFLMVTKPIL